MAVLLTDPFDALFHFQQALDQLRQSELAGCGPERPGRLSAAQCLPQGRRRRNYHGGAWYPEVGPAHRGEGQHDPHRRHEVSGA
jgi:hypothetical protein